MLNLEKINYKDYSIKETNIPEVEKKRKEKELIEYENLEQNIIRSWNMLKKTHILKSNECCSVRAVTYKLYQDDLGAGSHEHIIYKFDEKGFEDYRNFIVKYICYKRVFNFYFNIYKISIRSGLERIKEREKGFMASAKTTSTTNLISLDFDDIEYDEYLKLKNDLFSRGIYTLDVFSGHGYHIHFLIEDTEDTNLLKKLIKIFQELGYNPDVACCDCGRSLRIPFLYNQKPKYEMARMAEIIDGEYRSKMYSISELFSRLGYDYETFTIEQPERRKSTGRPKKESVEAEKEVVLFECGSDLTKLYDIDVRSLPIGIANMLKGFQKGYANLQVMALTSYFKNRGCTLEETIDILKTTQQINGNSWNDWNIEDETERFYNSYSHVNNFIKNELENIFGSFEMEYKIPVGYDSKQTKLYIYLLLNSNSRQKNIINDMNISKNTLYKMIENSNLIKFENRIYSIKDDFVFDKYIIVDKNELERLNSLDYKEIGIYTYLKWRAGIKKFIKVSIASIKENTGISEKTISNTNTSLEKRGLIKIKRFKYKEHNETEFYKESNEYTIL